MKKITIEGNHTLSGEINISGAKNSIVALLPATILADEPVTITNVPNIKDVEATIAILQYLGSEITYQNNTIIIDNKNIQNKEIPDNLANKLRASYYFMGALLSKFKEASISYPGGCPIGKRPIDIHLNSFKKLNIDVSIENNNYHLKTNNIISNTITLAKPSVGATINILLTTAKTKTTTIINNPAKEPEINNLIEFLNKMGTNIIINKDNIIINGSSYLKSTTIQTIPDRIETGTYLIIGALLGNKLKINNINPLVNTALINKLKESNTSMTLTDSSITISKNHFIKPVNITTKEYPGFPTDLQQPFTTYLTQAMGKSTIKETIYENRFQNVKELNKLNSHINIDNNKQITINGPTKLVGNIVNSTDLRGGASLIIAGLIAEGTTTITNIEHILRGYDNIINKLKNVGAKIEIE
ncbi:MAG: UDP-N-acetylglucosamine 1-carboxyvinyltransferase [bacterium]|nr:UDP-N-acetylglucosamine 1-carboxyvinyltransferase [bacterium]